MTDDLRNLSRAASAVMADDAWVLEHACRPGTWFFAGGLAVAVLVALHVAWWLAAIVAFGVGTVLNEREKRQIKRRLSASGARDE